MISGRSIQVWVGVLATWVAADAVTGEIWRQQTFADFRQGQSDDGGVYLYPAADCTVRTVCSFDYNQDGANDILYACSHDTWHAPPTYIYMNDAGTFDPRFRWLLLNDGAHAGTLDDLNGDGERDLVFAQNQRPGVIIYYNNDGQFSPARSATIDCDAVSCLRIADADGNGYQDLLALSGRGVLIFMGTATGISGKDPIELAARGSYRFDAADLDGDHHLDIVVADKSNDAGTTMVYWGDSEGHFASRARPPLVVARTLDDLRWGQILDPRDACGHVGQVFTGSIHDNPPEKTSCFLRNHRLIDRDRFKITR